MDDMTKLKVSFEDVLTVCDPRKLTQYCQFILTIYFCLHGQELQSTMRKGVVFEEEQEIETVHLATDLLRKNCLGGIKRRSFVTAGRINNSNQVANVKMLLDKSNPDLERFFQRAHPSFHQSNQFWFIKSPLGHNLLAQMMGRISEREVLPKNYTNYCLCTTYTTTLIKSGFAAC